MISDPDELATWLADDVDLDVAPGPAAASPTTTRRYDVEVDEVDEGERVVWRWRPVDDDGDAPASRVELVVAPDVHAAAASRSSRRARRPAPRPSIDAAAVGAPPTPLAGGRCAPRLASLRAGLCVVA